MFKTINYKRYLTSTEISNKSRNYIKKNLQEPSGNAAAHYPYEATSSSPFNICSNTPIIQGCRRKMYSNNNNNNNDFFT